MRNSLSRTIDIPSKIKNGMISLMLLLALTGCMSDETDDATTNQGTLTEDVTDTDNSLDKLHESMDKLDKSMDELLASTDSLSKSLDKLLKQVTEENRQDSIDKHRDPATMKFPQFKNPVIKTTKVADCMKDSTTLLPLADIVDTLRQEAEKGKIFVLEGSPEHMLFKDSLFLYNVFSQTNGLGNQVTDIIKKKYEPGHSGLSKEQEKKLHTRFLNYIEGKVRGVEQERHSEVRNSVIKKDVRDGVILYYTNIDKHAPGVIAYHPTIKPKDWYYIFSPFNPYNTADYYSLSYDKPKQDMKTISPEVFDAYGVNNEHDIHYILDAINTGIPFSMDSLGTHDAAPIAEKQDTNATYTQHYKIKMNGEHMLYIKDYSSPDNDRVNIDGNEYVINATPIQVDLNTAVGGKVYVKIVNEGQVPPNTLLLTLGSYTKKLEGKTGEVILLEFEE